mgnify:CR=1 FL=1
MQKILNYRMKTRNIKVKVVIKAPAHEIYEALMDSRKHSKLTGDKSSISRKVGGKIKAYGKYIEGKNLKLVKDKKIVQLWRASDWPKKHFSTVTFLLKEKKGKTTLLFTQIKVPILGKGMDVTAPAWNLYYWRPLKLMLEK